MDAVLIMLGILAFFAWAIGPFCMNIPRSWNPWFPVLWYLVPFPLVMWFIGSTTN